MSLEVFSSKINSGLLQFSSKSFSNIESLRWLWRDTSTCPAVLNFLSTSADDGRVVLNLMKTFRTRLHLASIFSSVSVTQVVDTLPVDSIDCCII